MPDDNRNLVEQIKAEHAAVQSFMRTAIDHAVIAGELLHELKRRIGHGGFERYVKAECRFSPRSARGYMALARALPKLPEAERRRVAALGLRDALSALATTTRQVAALPAPAVATIIKEAQKEKLSSAVSRARTAERVAAWQAEDAARRPYETVTVGTFPPEVTAEERWTSGAAWRLGLRLGIVMALRDATREREWLTDKDIAEALNDAYCAVLDIGLRETIETIFELRAAYQEAVKEEPDEPEHAVPPSDPEQMAGVQP